MSENVNQVCKYAQRRYFNLSSEGIYAVINGRLGTTHKVFSAKLPKQARRARISAEIGAENVPRPLITGK